MNAFWHDGDYYLPPSDHPDAAAYLGTAAFSRPVTLLKLEAKEAFPPFFEAGREHPVEVSVDPSRAYPVAVVLLSTDAFRKKLETAERKCLGCRWKGGAEREGRETCPALSLYDGCPLRDEGFDPGFLFATAAFWRRIEAALPALKRFVAKRAFARAAKSVDRLLQGLPDVFVAFAPGTVKPVLMLSGAGNDFQHLVAQYLAYTAPKPVTDVLDVLSSFPKGIFRRLDGRRRDGHERRPPRVICEPVRTDRPRFDLTILVPEASKESAPDDAFLFLCERIGEHKLMGAMNSIRFVDDSGFDLDYHEKAVDLGDPHSNVVSAEDYERIVDAAYDAENDRSGLESPFCFYEYYDVSEEEPIGALADVKVVNTCFMELDEDLLYGDERILPAVFDAGVGVGRIAVDVAMNAAGSRDLVKRLDDLLNRFIHFAGGSVPYGLHLCERRTIFNFLIMDKRIVRNAVRALAPVLKTYGATYAEVWREGESTARADFDLTIGEFDR